MARDAQRTVHRLSRRAWILGSDPWKTVQLGPLERLRSLCELALTQGHEPHLVTPPGTAQPPTQFHPHALDVTILKEIRPGDIVVASAFLPPRILWALMRSAIPFHVDFYCVGATEGLASRHMNPPWRNRLGRRRTAQRYRMLLDRAERLYFSNEAQMLLLAGTCYPEADEFTAARLDHLPERSVIAPMGVRNEPFPFDVPNPYPPELRNRPVFLWGGGIWEWFDVSALLDAFALLKAQDSSAVLFFLVGNNPSSSANQDHAPSAARRQAQDLGLLGHNVFFNDRSVTPAELPGYLQHCYAGILSNAANLEAAAAWRTRYLDLLWAGKPLVVNRTDPLACAMFRNGSAALAESGTAQELADAIARLCADPDIYATMANATRTAKITCPGPSPIARHWIPSLFSDAGRRPHPLHGLRWSLGL